MRRSALPALVRPHSLARLVLSVALLLIALPTCHATAERVARRVTASAQPAHLPMPQSATVAADHLDTWLARPRAADPDHDPDTHHHRQCADRVASWVA